MDQDEKALKQLIEKLPIKKRAAKLRSLLPIIDQRLKEGVTQEDIIELLCSQGWSINVNTFRSHLYNYRKSLTTTKTISLPSTPEAPSLVVPYSEPERSDMLDARKRDEFCEKYLNQKLPIFEKE